MSVKIGDLVIVKTDEVEITQIYSSHPLRSYLEPVKLKVNKGTIFEVIQVFKEHNSAHILPVNFNITTEYVIIAELDNLIKCGRAVEILYGKRRK